MPKKKTSLSGSDEWSNCAEDGCEMKSCTKLKSPYCYFHTLIKSRGALINEMIRMNTEIIDLKDQIRRLKCDKEQS